MGADAERRVQCVIEQARRIGRRLVPARQRHVFREMVADGARQRRRERGRRRRPDGRVVGQRVAERLLQSRGVGGVRAQLPQVGDGLVAAPRRAGSGQQLVGQHGHGETIRRGPQRRPVIISRAVYGLRTGTSSCTCSSALAIPKPVTHTPSDDTQHVAQVQRSMLEPPRVGRVDRAGELRDPLHRLPRTRLAPQRDVERLALDVLANHVRGTRFEARRQRRHDCRMRDLHVDDVGQRVPEHLDLLGRQLELEALDGDRSIAVGFTGAKDGTENAGTCLMQNPVRAECAGT